MKTIEKLDSETLLVTDGKLKYVQFESLLKYEDRLTHCFSTRIGGVSTGECSSLNLGYKRNDIPENVSENFKIICRALDIDTESLVFSNQVHDNRVRFIKAGSSSPESDNSDRGFDGLATTEKGITLVTFYADCVPVLLYEKSGKAAAGVHSGWRSTLKGIVREAVEVLKNDAGIIPSELVCVIGPCIGECCFEVDTDVYKQFIAVYPEEKHYTNLNNGKWKIDLRGIIKQDAIAAGIMEDDIHLSSVCTKCRKDLFYSFRGDNGKTGSLAAFMRLK